jgi:hypothetical protein
VSVVFCISGHGFGHASRQVEVVNALGRLVPGLPIHVVSAAPRWLLDHTIDVPVSIDPRACDAGAVQRDSLDLDVEATLGAAMAFEAQTADPLAQALAEDWRRRDARVVVCDVPPTGCSAAALAGIPAVALANFTWDWIYEEYLDEVPAASALPARLRARYAEAAAGWRLPMSGGFEGFRTVVDMPWIARRSARTPEDTRRALGLDATRPRVLVSFGGYGVRDWSLALHTGAPYQLVVTTGAEHLPHDAPPDAVVLDRLRLREHGCRYEDLIAACDVVVSKPGYGIVSECVANRTALLYTDRGRFREYTVMVEAMPRVLRARYLSREALLTGRWDDAVAALVDMPAPVEQPLVNGADVAAGMISAMV